MNAQEMPSVDVATMEAELARLRADRERGPGPWWARLFLKSVVFFYLSVALLTIVTGDAARVFDFSGRGLLLRVGPAVLFGLLVTPLAIVNTRRRERRGAEAWARTIEREWKRLSGASWLRHTLLMGVKLGAGVGVPVGALLAVAMPPSVISAGQRPLAFLAFVGLTLAWTIPAAFVLRLLILRDYRRFVSPPAAG